jgi:catalase
MAERQLMTAAGVPVADNQESPSAGPRGPDPVADNQPGPRTPRPGR